MKGTQMQIICVLSGAMRLGLVNIREQTGHDDSLPYRADIYVQDGKPGDVEYKLLAEIWNDGWGGESEIRRVDYTPETEDLIKRVHNLCDVHNFLYQGTPICPYSIETLCDCMAEGWLYCDGEAKKKTILYRFDDDPVTIKNNGNNLYKIFR